MTEPKRERYLISYTDPETGEPAEHEGEYAEMVGIATAKEVAEDHAYMLADKGPWMMKLLR